MSKKISEEELQQMLDNLERDGIVKCEIVNGEKCYGITKLGEEIVKQSEANPSKAN